MMRYIITITLIELEQLMEWQIICLNKTSTLILPLFSIRTILEAKVYRCLLMQVQIKTHQIVLRDRIREGQVTSLKQVLRLSLASKLIVQLSKSYGPRKILEMLQIKVVLIVSLKFQQPTMRRQFLFHLKILIIERPQGVDQFLQETKKLMQNKTFQQTNSCGIMSTIF